MTDIAKLRCATEDDVTAALKAASFGNWPQDEADLVEFFNLMLYTILGEEAGDAEM